MPPKAKFTRCLNFDQCKTQVLTKHMGKPHNYTVTVHGELKDRKCPGIPR